MEKRCLQGCTNQICQGEEVEREIRNRAKYGIGQFPYYSQEEIEASLRTNRRQAEKAHCPTLYIQESGTIFESEVQ